MDGAESPGVPIEAPGEAVQDLLPRARIGLRPPMHMVILA